MLNKPTGSMNYSYYPPPPRKCGATVFGFGNDKGREKIIENIRG